MSRTGKDLTGQRFGKLVVTGFAGYGQNKKQRYGLWECHCDCGNTCQVQGNALTSGRRKSCGCIHVSAASLAGQRFGKLTVIGEDPDNHTTLSKVICRCDCGKEKSIAVRSLRKGNVIDCGCGKKRNTPTDFRIRLYDEKQEEKRNAFQRADMSAIRTLNDWIYVWLRSVLPNVIKETTICVYAETMEHHIQPYLGDLELSKITEEKVAEWVEHLKKAPLTGTLDGKMKEGTVRNTLSVLSSCMRDAQKYALIDHNPCLKALWIPEKRNVYEDQEWLTQDQVDQLEALLRTYTDEDGYPLGLGFQLVLYAGITLSEAVALRWSDVDFENKNLTVRNFVAVRREAGSTGVDRYYEMESLSGRKRRVIPIPDSLMEELLRVWKSYQPGEEDFVLCRSDREPVRMERMRAALLRQGNSCGIGNVTPRMLRDTYAMRAVRSGATSDMIAELMGFASPQQVVRRYMPKAAADKRELVNKMFADKF